MKSEFASFDQPTVFIVDDDPAVRQSLVTLLRSMDLAAEPFESAEHFLQSIDGSRPGCILLDVRMPGLGGLALLEKLKEDGISLPSIVMSAYGDVPMVVRAIKAGALNFLEKPCRDQQLWEALQEALRWDAQHRRQLAMRAKIRQRLERLTSGERDVLRYLVEGLSNKAIATELAVSVRAVEVRRSKLMKKMKADSLAELIRLTLVLTTDFGKPQLA